MDITEKLPKIILSADASGAQQAAREGMLVMIIDIIDMSTSLESAIDAGALAVFGASPDVTRAPVETAPEHVGMAAGRLAKEYGTNIILIAEPRAGRDDERLARCQKLIKGIEKEQSFIEKVLPNLGAEIYKLADFENRVVVAASDTGGVAYDAAFLFTSQVYTGTVARSKNKKGMEPALAAVERIWQHYRETDSGIAIVAASSNSQEDILAAKLIFELTLSRFRKQ